MLIDTVSVIVRGGNGGRGAATLSRTAQTAKAGPDGGNGGNGGNIYIRGNHNLTDLRQFRYKKKVTAEDGTNGRKGNLFGRNAEHIYVEVPLHSQITDEETGQIYEIGTSEKPILIARGGRGGRGNVAFKTAINRTPIIAEPGEAGQERKLLFVLKLIADIGLIGLPNAGKSSLLTVLTNATPTIGAYPFTTLEPNLGMFGTHPIADIPGLIEGASEGKGLGIKFLKHIEKTKILMHCIDLTSTDPLKDYETVRAEFKAYSEVLLTKPEIILLNKSDLVTDEVAKSVKALFEKKGHTVYISSIYQPDSIKSLKEKITALVENNDPQTNLT